MFGFAERNPQSRLRRASPFPKGPLGCAGRDEDLPHLNGAHRAVVCRGLNLVGQVGAHLRGEGGGGAAVGDEKHIGAGAGAQAAADTVSVYMDLHGESLLVNKLVPLVCPCPADLCETGP